MSTERAAGIVLGLRHEIGGDPFGPALAADDDDFGRAGVEVDRTVRRDLRFRGRDPAAPGSDDLVDTWHGLSAVGERGNGVCASNREQP